MLELQKCFDFTGKHILAKLEKYFIKNAPDTMGASMTSPL